MEESGSLFSSFLISLGTKMFPVARKLASKAAPALASGALSTLGSPRIDKIFGKGITVPKKRIPALVPYEKEFTTKQINDKTYQTTGKLEFKPTQKQIQGGLLGTLAGFDWHSKGNEFRETESARTTCGRFRYSKINRFGCVC